jgi:DNA-binding response OmpR family regulator
MLILSGRTGVADKVGAPEELAARLRVLQRCEPPRNNGPVLMSGPLQIDTATRIATVNRAPLILAATEESVLHMLAQYAGKFVPRQRLIDAIWGAGAAGKISELQNYIARLRRKLEEHGGSNLIRGHGSVGYSLALAAENAYTETKTVL